MKRLGLCTLLPLALVAVACKQLPGAVLAPFACDAGLLRSTMALAGKGRLVLPSADAAFGRLDSRSRVEVLQTTCGIGVTWLRYMKPNRMQFGGVLNTGSGSRPRTMQESRETQIGNRLGYIGHIFSAPWPGIGVTAHRMLLPDAWNEVPVGRPEPSFYLISRPEPAVRDLALRVLTNGPQQIFVEQWRGLEYRCPFGAQCPAPNLDPRLFARFTAILRVDVRTGLPVSLTTAGQSRGLDRRHRLVWGQPRLLSQTVFRYGGNFSIGFVKG